MSASESLETMLDAIKRRREEEAAARGISLDELDAEDAREEREAKARDAARAERRARRHVLEHCGARVPEATAEAFVNGTLLETPAVLAVREWLDGNASYCMLLGGTGAGKTVGSLVALARVGGVFVRSPDLGAAIEPWSAETRRGVERVDPSEPTLFVLDDLGLERAEDARWATSFDELIDARQGTRFGRRLRTLITSNLTTEQIRDRYSERARDRMRPSMLVRTLTTTSMRRKP